MPARISERTCAKCGQTFQGRSTKNYCSASCKALAGWETRGRGRHYPQCTCVVCGKEFQPKYYRPDQPTCGHECGMILRVRNGWKSPYSNGRRPPGWKGGYTQKQGYRMIYAPDHSTARKDGYALEHRVMMERHIGRALETFEKVHHRNGIKDDNRIENLEIVTLARPNGTVICPHCRKSFQVH